MASPAVDKHQYGIMHVIRNSFLSQNYHYSNYWDVVDVETVRNSDLEEQFQEKRKDFIHMGRTKDELTERLLMGCYIKDEDIKFISLNGLQCGKRGTTSYLGNGSKGVTLGKHADILLKSFYNDGYEQCWIVVYKAVCGRQKEVLHIQTPPYREPMHDADCHVSILAPVPAEDCLRIQDIKAQVFMFDKDENGDFLRRPRQCVPIACVKFKRASPIGSETMTTAVDQTIPSEKSTAGNTKDSFTLLKDSLAKMKESFVLLSKETVINSKAKYANQTKVPADVPGHKNVQKPRTDSNKRKTVRSETHKRDELDKRKSNVSANTERVNEGDHLIATDAESSEVVATEGATSKKCAKKVPHTHREISKDKKTKLASLSVSTSEERSLALSTSVKATCGEVDKTDSSLSKKRESRPNRVAKEPPTRASSAEAMSQGRERDRKCPSKVDFPIGNATVDKEATSKTDKIHQNSGSSIMPVRPHRKTRLIDALPVSSLSADPSLTSAFSRRPPSVVVSSPIELTKPIKSILRNPISTVQNGSSLSAFTSSTSGLQSCSTISSCLTTTSSVSQKQPNCDSEALTKSIIHPVAPIQGNNACQTQANLTYKLNSDGDINIPLFNIPTSSILHAKPASIANRSWSTSAVEPNAKITLNTCPTTCSLNSTSTASVSGSKYSPSQYKLLKSNSISQSKLSVSNQPNGTFETQPMQSPAICTTPVRGHTNLTTLDPNNGPIMSVPTQIKSASDRRHSTASTAEVEDIFSVVLSSGSTTHPYPVNKKSDKPRTVAQSKPDHSTKTEPKSEFQSHSTSPSLNGNFTLTCSTNQATKESVAKPFLRSAPDKCLTKDSTRSSCKPKVIDIPLNAPIVAIPQKNLLLLQHGFISSITKQLASDLNDVANLLRSSKPEKVNHREKNALLSLREINSKFMELTPICVQYKQLFRHLKDGHPVHLPELDQLYSQEYMMNECCNVLGKVFSEYKASQLKSETVLEKRSLAIAWLVCNKTELISSINNIKSIVENVVSTSDLRPVLGTKYSPSTPEENCASSVSIGSSTDIPKAVKEKQSSSPGPYQDLGQTTEATNIKTSSQQDRTPNNQVTVETNIQRLTEVTESEATVLNVDHLEKLGRNPSESEEGFGSSLQTVEVSLPLDNCFGDAQDKSREASQLRSETSSYNGRNAVIGGFSEQNGTEMESNASECQTNAAVEKISQADVEQDTSSSSTVSKDLNSESNSVGCVPIFLNNGSTSAEHPPILAAAACGADKFNIHKTIKTERIDPPNLIIQTPQTIILGADDFTPPCCTSEDGHVNSIVQSALPQSGKSNGLPSKEFSSDIESSGSVVRLQENVQDGTRYESCVSLDSKQSILSQDFLDEIPPLLTPDCAFGFSSIVYNVKSDEPPILEANREETSGKYHNVRSPLAVTPRDWPTLVVTPRNSPPLVVTPRNSPPLAVTPRDSPTLACTPMDWPALVVTPRNLPPLVVTPRNSPPLVVTPRNSPPLVGTPRNSPTLARTPMDWPALVVTPRNSPPLVVTPRDSPTSVVTPRESPTSAVTPRDSPSLVVTQRNVALSAVTQRGSPALVVTPRNSPPLVVTPRNSPPLVVTSRDSSSSAMTQRDSPALVVTPRNSPALVVTPMNSPPLVITPRNSPALFVTPRDSPLSAMTQRDSLSLAVTPKESSTCDALKRSLDPDTSDLVLLISGLHMSTIIKNCDEMVASDSFPTDREFRADDKASMAIDTKVCESVKMQIELDVSTDTQMKDDMLLAFVKEMDEENGYSKENRYARIVGELTGVDLMTVEKEINTRNSVNYQSNGYPVTKCLQPIHGDSNENTYPVIDTSCEQRVYSDQLDRPDEKPKSELELCQLPSRLITGDESPTTDLTTSNMKRGQLENSDQYGEAYTAILDGVGICDSDQSSYVYNIEPDDDFDADPVCSYDDSQNIPKKPSADTQQDLLDTGTGEDDPVSHQVHELDSSKPCDDSGNFLERNPTKKPQASSDSSTETLEANVCKSPCSVLLQESTSEPSQNESENLRHEQDTVSTSQPVTSTCQTGVFALSLSSSESVPSEVHEESQEVNSSSYEVQRMSVPVQPPQSSSPVMPEDSCSRTCTPSVVRSASPPTVYTDPPQSPPPEPCLLLSAVIKQEITTDDPDTSPVEMKRYPLSPKRTGRKRKRENKQNQEEQMVVILDEGLESGCSAPAQRQRSAAWSTIHLCSNQGADLSELSDSITKVVQFCSSDATYGSGKPFRAKARPESTDRHSTVSAAGSTTAAGLVDDKLMDGMRPKTASVSVSSIHSQRRQNDDDASRTNDERGARNEDRHRSRRRSSSRLRSNDMERLSSESRRDRIRDTSTEDKRTSPKRRRTTCHGPERDQRVRPAVRLSSGGSHDGLHERSYRDETNQAAAVDGRRRFPERSSSRRPNIDTTPSKNWRGSEERRNYRNVTYKCSPTRCDDQNTRSRSTRPMHQTAGAASSKTFDWRPFGEIMRGDVLSTDQTDDGSRTVIDPSTLKRQFWSKSHPRFRCHDGCDRRCMTGPTVPQDADKRHRRAPGGSAEKSSPAHDMDILEETLRLNLEMTESSKSIDDGEMKSPTGDETMRVRRGSKRSLARSTDSSTAKRHGKLRNRTRDNSKDSYSKDDEAEVKEKEVVSKEEEIDDFRSTTSSKRSKTLSRQDKHSDYEDHVSPNGLLTNHEEEVTAKHSFKQNMKTSVSSVGTTDRALQPSRCGRSSVASGFSGSEGRTSRELGNDETQSLQDTFTIRMTKSPVHHTSCQVPPLSAAAAQHPSSASAATVSVNLARTSVTYETQILQTSNFSTQVYIEKYKKIVN